MEQGRELYECVKEYARENGIYHLKAYTELLEKGLNVVSAANQL